MINSPKKVNCPTCQEVVMWVESNEHRPFCSQRCKLIDFGDWAMEKHSIPGESMVEQDDEDQYS